MSPSGSHRLVGGRYRYRLEEGHLFLLAILRCAGGVGLSFCFGDGSFNLEPARVSLVGLASACVGKHHRERASGSSDNDPPDPTFCCSFRCRQNASHLHILFRYLAFLGRGLSVSEHGLIAVLIPALVGEEADHVIAAKPPSAANCATSSTDVTENIPMIPVATLTRSI
jgi:hypothetical protein